MRTVDIDGTNSSNDVSSSNSASYYSNSSDPLQAMLDYAKATGSEAAYENYLNNWFNAQMSNSAYQRAADDLEKAGLNRWLAVNNSASSPTSSSKSYSEELLAAQQRELESKKNGANIVAKILTVLLAALLL